MIRFNTEIPAQDSANHLLAELYRGMDNSAARALGLKPRTSGDTCQYCGGSGCVWCGGRGTTIRQ